MKKENGVLLFALGQVVMTQGVAGLNMDVSPYLARHARGDWGTLDESEAEQNEMAVKTGTRILSAYDVPILDGNSCRIWIITESDRSYTTILLPAEY